ncbi:MAG: glycerophosphoryl diester phosphodiesterase [Alphaproteobacteria bacterium]|nr:glycerophosphoryl diester phosphodiesterase [Alphaproteobacteria bacterium]NCQ87907.1 glycerophosphoryl diester phosphodiesterase [Alphaproteobacteria bacterium]NCT05586.1 glycerophosphoryl diester phosphodiesterase [Alphaproteobacteria bacterium]
MLKLPKVIGHRGAAAYAPENTIEGIHTAADMGIKWVELDVKLTKDDIPIIFHDETLDRTTNGSGLVAETPYDYIRQLECGSWYGDSFAGIKIPTLEEVVDVLIERDMGLNLEIKPCPGREKETAEAALDMLSHYWDNHDGLLISSFQHVSLEAAKDVAADWSRGLLLAPENDEDINAAVINPNWKDIADYLDVKTLNIAHSLADRETIEEIIDAELKVLVYTVNDPMDARLLQSWGVDCVFSDEPDVILANLLTVH